MGYIYKAIDRAKKQIQVNFKNVRSRYVVYTDIIDLRWNTQLHGPLHAAGYFLNPRYHYSSDFNATFDIKKGFYDVVTRMCSSAEERRNIDKQVELFTMAKDTRDRKHPGICLLTCNVRLVLMFFFCTSM
ncbi:uncharacterized protein LOC113278410 [Papaver somniferum]|uniref:uncharacterized protein LOC113278410 n=1 Tax=Papaver somniferum TaxID=3469 RepID=UPI000E70483E|nr:uncharacterized protein LOC113278410 [Papaver somniferum]